MHGCCNSSALSECTIPTECVASTAMSSLCTDEQCSSNNAIAKCTQSTAPECYEYQFAYEATTMTQHGCTSSGFTLTVPRSYGPTSTGTPVIITMTAPAITLHTTPGAGTAPNPADAGFTYTTTATQTIYHLTELPNSSNGSSSANIGAIVGGAVGGFAAISATAFGIFYVRRKTRKDRERKAAAAAAAAVPVSPEEKTFKGILYLSTSSLSCRNNLWQRCLSHLRSSMEVRSGMRRQLRLSTYKDPVVEGARPCE